MKSKKQVRDFRRISVSFECEFWTTYTKVTVVEKGQNKKETGP